MPNLKYKVSVITVTYGERWPFLEKVVQRVLSFNQVANVIIVNNAAAYDVDARVALWQDNRITVINHAENLGSASGYKAGLLYAHEHTTAKFCFLLDDDNLPDAEVLDHLLKAWDQVPGDKALTALYCLRKDRKAHVRIAKGADPAGYYLAPDSFIGFNLFRIWSNQLRKAKEKELDKKPYLPFAKIPYVPYGGLFIPRQLLSQIGYPDERFFLYVDDSEFTHRITTIGGTIWLVPNCEVTDIDQSQGVGYKKKMFSSLYLDRWSFRTYYNVRNTVYFHHQAAVKSELVFRLNKFIYMAWLKVVSIVSSRQSEYKKLSVAVKDGLQGNLGKADSNKF